MFSEFAEVSAATWGVIVALLLVGIIVFAVSKDKKRWTARMLANGALCIALATVLSFVTLYKMPQGGTITLASMLPIFLFSYAYGVGPGMLVGAAYGFVQFLQGGLYFVHPIELLLDYPLAFAMLGLAGLANKFSDKWGMIPGIILGTFGRFVCAFLSGMIFFACMRRRVRILWCIPSCTTDCTLCRKPSSASFLRSSRRFVSWRSASRSRIDLT